MKAGHNITEIVSKEGKYMCTALNLDGFFGRTLDVECSYGEKVTLTPRGAGLNFKYEGEMSSHLALLGMAAVIDGVPLYYDAVNEAGICMAALKFPGNAVYREACDNSKNVASFELIPWVLSQCKTLAAARELISKTNITNDDFSDSVKSTPLHFIVADGKSAIVVESTAEGVQIYNNPLGVLTNNPPFCYHTARICDFMHLTPDYPENTLCKNTVLKPYSGGMGAIGLPGDFSSPSRFVRAVFAKNHIDCMGKQSERVGAFFHVMDTVSVPRGCEKNSDRKCVYTLYTSCIDITARTYFFTTYNNRRIRAVELDNVEIDGDTPVCYEINAGEDILFL